MPGESGYVIGPADRATLLRGPLCAILMQRGDRMAGSLSLVEHPLGEIVTGQGPPEPGRLAELAERYGLGLDLASVPRLAAAHGLLVPGAPPGTP